MSDFGGHDDRRAAQESWRRLRGFALHLAGYFLVMIVLVAVNFGFDRDNPWFVLPMVGWGAVLAVHAAYAMGLFKVFR
jgi:hypothetical protein